MCLVGRKGGDPPGLRGGVGNDVIYSERRGQSQKPEEIYQLIEQLVPDGRHGFCASFLCCTSVLAGAVACQNYRMHE